MSNENLINDLMKLGKAKANPGTAAMRAQVAKDAGDEMMTLMSLVATMIVEYADCYKLDRDATLQEFGNLFKAAADCKAFKFRRDK